VSPDELTLVFSSARAGGAGGADLWQAERTSRTGVFSAPVPLPGVNTSANEGRAALSSDRLSVIFTSDRPGGLGGSDLWMATRASSDDDFGLATNLGELNGAAADIDPSLSEDGLDVLFASSRGGRSELWRAQRSCE